ncbi:MAG: prepilin-type N-terminal cleavage/methylation domain-containing protein [Verrucomicrobiota bacterium]
MKTSPRTSKGFTLVEIMIVVVIIGLLAAMAVPAFNKVRTSSQDKAVANNLRQISQAAEQYFTEKGLSSVTSADLVGSNSTQYVKTFATVANESYTATVLERTAITASGIAGARTVTIAP